jgi:hypothetical protein
MLSLSTYYEQKEMKFWSIGTGLARLCGTGLFLVMNYWLDVRVIFGINLLIYLFGYSIGLYLLKPLNHISIENKIDVSSNTVEHISNNSESLTNVPLDDDIQTNREVEFDLEYQEDPVGRSSRVMKHLNFIFDIYPLLIAYFTSYFLGFAYIPILVTSNIEYQLSQFITGVAIFSGRLLGNYISFIQNIRIFGMIHIYSVISIMIFTITISLKIRIPFVALNLMLFITYFINGLSYPMVYNNIYRKEEYKEGKEWYMGAVGQYTCLFMIIGCLVGYPIQFIFQ